MNKPKIDNAEFARIVEMTPEEAKSFMEGFGQHHSVQIVKLDDWLPIETAPKDGSSILVGKGEPFSSVDQVEWNLMDEYWCATGGKRKCGNSLDYTPTHWQHLPPPPATDTISA